MRPPARVPYLGGLFLLAMLLACCGDNGTTRVPASTTVSTPSAGEEQLTPLPDVASTVITLVNRERTAAGCPELTPNPALTQAAQAHSRDMAAGRFISHEGSAGSTPAQRVQEAGYQYRIVAENVAAGPLTAEEAVHGWMESPEHRENILNCALRETGVGVVKAPVDRTYGIYWTQLFATPL